MNNAQFSTTYDLFVLNHSTINIAPTFTVYDRKGSVVRVLEKNEGVKKQQIRSWRTTC